MRRIEQTGPFKRDFKRESKGPHREFLAREFVGIVRAIAKDDVLPAKHPSNTSLARIIPLAHDGERRDLGV